MNLKPPTQEAFFVRRGGDKRTVGSDYRGLAEVWSRDTDATLTEPTSAGSITTRGKE